RPLPGPGLVTTLGRNCLHCRSPGPRRLRRRARRPRASQSVLDSGVLTHEEDSLAGTIATIALIVNDQLDAARRRCEAVIETARPRGWSSPSPTAASCAPWR